MSVKDGGSDYRVGKACLFEKILHNYLPSEIGPVGCLGRVGHTKMNYFTNSCFLGSKK